MASIYTNDEIIRMKKKVLKNKLKSETERSEHLIIMYFEACQDRRRGEKEINRLKDIIVTSHEELLYSMRH